MINVCEEDKHVTAITGVTQFLISMTNRRRFSEQRKKNDLLNLAPGDK